MFLVPGMEVESSSWASVSIRQENDECDTVSLKTVPTECLAAPRIPDICGSRLKSSRETIRATEGDDKSSVNGVSISAR